MNNIREKLINHYRTCSCDQYGQMSTIDIYRIIDGKDVEQIKELSSMVRISTFGSRYGTYHGINPWGAFQFPEIEAECRQAFAENENRKRNLNSW